MSIVGPRPHMLLDSKEFSEVIANYISSVTWRVQVSPACPRSGAAVVRPSTFQSIFRRRYQWDAYYVRNVNFALDIKIMAETGWLMLKSLLRRGADDEPIAAEKASFDKGASSPSFEHAEIAVK